MKKIVLTLLLFITLGVPYALAQELDLAQRIDKVEEAMTGPLFKNVDIFGTIEAEVFYSDDFAGHETSDIDLATFDLGIEVALSESVGAFGVLSWDNEEDSFGLDEGGIVLGNVSNGASLTVGRLYVPFGVFETAMVSDPLTQELGETQEGAAVATYTSNGFSASTYIFNGTDNEEDDDNINSFGIDLGYEYSSDTVNLAIHGGWISNILSAPVFEDIDEAEPSAAAALSITASIADFSLIGEYVAVLESDYNEQGDVKPSALNIELSYGLTVADKDAFVAIGFQATDDSASIELPEERYLAACGIELSEGLNLSLEYAHDEDYDESDGGSAESADTVTGLLAFEF